MLSVTTLRVSPSIGFRCWLGPSPLVLCLSLRWPWIDRSLLSMWLRLAFSESVRAPISDSSCRTIPQKQLRAERPMEQKHYIIRGGLEGRARLVVLSRIMRPTTLSLLDRAGIRPGMNCLEIGCGSGDVAFDLARIVGPAGRVVATDIDEIKLQLARQQAAQDHLSNLDFRFADILTGALEQFDFAHARFVLTHLADPRKALEKVRQAIQPGGVVAVEDTIFVGTSFI